jgi:hypothetical protein
MGMHSSSPDSGSSSNSSKNNLRFTSLRARLEPAPIRAVTGLAGSKRTTISWDLTRTRLGHIYGKVQDSTINHQNHGNPRRVEDQSLLCFPQSRQRSATPQEGIAAMVPKWGTYWATVAANRATVRSFNSACKNAACSSRWLYSDQTAPPECLTICPTKLS